MTDRNMPAYPCPESSQCQFGDQDESGNDISHDGACLTGMEINQGKFYCNGRRHEK